MLRFFIISFLFLIFNYGFSQVNRYEIYVRSINKKKVDLKSLLNQDLKVNQVIGLVDSLNIFNVYIGENYKNVRSINEDELNKLKIIRECSNCFIEYLVFDSSGKGILAQEYENGKLVFERKYKKKHDWQE